ncbi:acyltransferase [Bacillus carboniphilus]|uniref:Acyltransferase n=1 Tax=Bacillus carboniphilus TaxID=86663 RepID=A0ABY9JS57_9BACI|nr:acyltransferase [Bacillus carboniphilus]WLR41573.1 acyltransferase [Bacillus carboniphilus]
MKRKREVIEKLSGIINIVIMLSKIFPKSFYLFLLKFTRHHDNYIAMFIRYICLKNIAKNCGENVAVFSGVYLHRVHQLELGDNVSIHPMCYINASGGIKIGNDVSIAHGTTILSEEHKFSSIELNIRDQGCELKQTVIDNNVWIGAGCRILAGCKINSGSIVAAGAVVKNEVRKNVIVGGVPAKIIKERK